MADDVVQLVREKMTGLDTFMGDVRQQLTGLDGRLEKLKQQALARPPLGMLHGQQAEDSTTVGGLVAHSEAVKQFVSGSVRGAARVALPGRVCKTIVTLETSGAKSGIQSAPVEPLPREPLGVLDLLPQLAMREGTLQVVRQKTKATPGAKVQLNEGDIKQEQTVDFATSTLAPITLAAWVPVSRQGAADVNGLMEFINSELLYAVKIAEEDQVLNGTSTFTTPVEGQLTGLNVNAAAITSAATKPIDAIADLIGGLIASGVQVSGIVMHPSDALRLSKEQTTDGTYLLGSPAMTPGNTLWGVSWAVSSKQPAGVVLAGDFRRGARLWYRQDAVVEVSSEHSDYFVRNMLAVRCEERVLLELVQPGYFGKTTLPAPAVGRSNGR